ncbi:Ig-like domain-containing protein [Mycolicibacterium vaccae]|uniref:Ig-like domain-containing protein n=1 Tax=Mycolicibacterium vaccae TaxID=1810 RepID=UPI003CE8EBE0
MATQRGRQRAEQRSEGFAVRRWLQLGVASAGMGAALMGYSLLGPQTGVAAADTGAGSSVSRTSQSDSLRTDRGERRAARTDRAERSTADTRRSGRPAAADAEVDTDIAGKAAVDTEDADAGRDTTAPQAEAAAPARTTATVAPQRERRTHARAAATSSATSTSASVAPQALPPEVNPAAAAETAGTERQQRVARLIDNWTARRLAFIASLSVSPERKAEMEASMWATRRTLMNQTPTVAPVQITGKLTGPITGTLNAVDPDGDPIRYVLTVRPREGTVVINSDGTYVYTPNEKFDGVDTFRVAVQDGFRINVFDVFRGSGTRTKETINQGAITFAFTFTEGSEHWTEDRRQALQRVADQMTAYFVVGRPVGLTFEVSGENDPDTTTLASAFSPYVSGRPGFHRTVVQQKLLTGRDANGQRADGEIDWNFAEDWGYGGVVAAHQYDFDSTVMHELLHTMGFMPGLSGPGENKARVWTAFAEFVVDRNRRSPFTWTYRWRSDFDGKLTGAAGGLFFGGQHAVAAYGGLVPLYTPDPWSSGSSMSHLDDLTFVGPDAQLMNAKVQAGPAARELSAIEIGILRDLGYTVFPVIPDYTWAAAGLVLLRRRPKAQA